MGSHPPDVLVIDRYEIGERATSACAAPTPWLHAMGVRRAIRQEMPCMAFHTPHGSARYRLPWSWSAFDYRELCRELWEQCDARFEIAKVADRSGGVVRTDRGELTAPLIVDALGCWIDRSVVRYGYAWSVPAGEEQRVGVGSYEPRHHVKEPTQEMARRLDVDPVRYQGNWFPHELRPAAEDGVFFAGDSAGHCLPLSGEGIRTAFYFGTECGRELRAVLAGERTREEALKRYAAFSASHARVYGLALRLQWLVPRVPPRLLALGFRALGRGRLVERAFSWYLEQASPSYAAAPTASPTVSAALPGVQSRTP